VTSVADPHPDGETSAATARHGALTAQLEELLLSARAQQSHLRRSLATVVEFLDRPPPA
jgi:ribulose 1,5-bisphosphate carboxylase large subunit-like protein